MLKIGLTGGIASGKSTVASMFRDREVPLLEMDPLGHELLEPGQAAYDEVVREFGNGVLDANKKVDRSRLGAIVFSDPAKRERLNQILHPRILDVVQKWFAALDRPGGPDFAVVEAALIFESGFNKSLDRVIVCWCGPEQQLARLVGRGLAAEQGRQRIAAQMPADAKRRLANDVIDCSGSMEETERQAGAVVERLKQLAASGRNVS